MPIKVQAELPAKEILRERIYLSWMRTGCPSGYTPDSDSDFKLDAPEGGDRASAAAIPVQHTTAGGCDFHDHEQP